MTITHDALDLTVQGPIPDIGTPWLYPPTPCPNRYGTSLDYPSPASGGITRDLLEFVHFNTFPTSVDIWKMYSKRKQVVFAPTGMLSYYILFSSVHLLLHASRLQQLKFDQNDFDCIITLRYAQEHQVSPSI